MLTFSSIPTSSKRYQYANSAVVSVAIASLIALDPSTVDPLNGYALLSSATMGFLAPVFTLMLLHSQGVKSWFATALTSISWILNTVVFFMLIRKLSRTDNTSFENGLNQLFQVSSCGGLSALSLCQQLTSTNPLADLNEFYTRRSANDLTSIDSLPVLWAWTTLVLIVLVIRESFQIARRQKAADPPDRPAETPAEDSGLKLLQHFSVLRPVVWKVMMLAVSSAVFTVFLVYEYLMVRRYRKMDVIDMGGWSFGQVVAVLFWVPPLLDVIHSMFSTKTPHHLPKRIVFSANV